MGDSEKQEQNQLLRAYLSCRNGLVRSLLKMRAREEDIDDLLQETYLRALHANERTEIKSLEGYLFTVSRNLVLEKLSRSSREINMEINDALLEMEDPAVERDLYYARKFEMFSDALRSLPEQKRRAILLRKFYGLSHREIAAKMHVSVSSVEKYIASGIKQCKRALIASGHDFKDQTDVQVGRSRRKSHKQGESG